MAKDADITRAIIKYNVVSMLHLQEKKTEQNNQDNQYKPI